MELPVENWYAALFQRHSRRAYEERKVEAAKLDRLREICASFRPFPGVRTVLVTEPPGDVFKGFIGSYGKVTGAPSYAAFVGDLGSSHVQEAVGYTGEAFVLEATALGLGTCWVAGFFRREVVARHLPLCGEEQVLAVTPVGYAVPGKTVTERLMSGFAKGHARKPVEEVVEGELPEEWMTKAVEAARLAPSAVNRQPWRFSAGEDGFTVSVAGASPEYGLSKRLDCGIAMLHVELGARHADAPGTWELLEDPEVARYTRT